MPTTLTSSFEQVADRVLQVKEGGLHSLYPD